MTKRTTNSGLIVPIMVMSLVTALLFVGNASAASWGKIKRNSEVREQFKNYNVLPEYNYFYNGWENNPYAIVGVLSEYSLVSKRDLWKAATDSDASIQNLVDALFEDGQFTVPYGFQILAPDGSEMGIFYSTITNVAVKMVGDKSFMLIFDKVYLWGGGRYDF